MAASGRRSLDRPSRPLRGASGRGDAWGVGGDDRDAHSPTTRRLAAHLNRRARWRWPEIVFWLAILAVIFAAPSRAAIINEVLIAGLFALSLDLILGLAGIVSLGHAAFFGLGAYAAAILASKGFADPTLGLVLGAAVAAVAGLATAPPAARRPRRGRRCRIGEALAGQIAAARAETEEHRMPNKRPATGGQWTTEPKQASDQHLVDDRRARHRLTITDRSAKPRRFGPAPAAPREAGGEASCRCCIGVRPPTPTLPRPEARRTASKDNPATTPPDAPPGGSFETRGFAFAPQDEAVVSPR